MHARLGQCSGMSPEQFQLPLVPIEKRLGRATISISVSGHPHGLVPKTCKQGRKLLDKGIVEPVALLLDRVIGHASSGQELEIRPMCPVENAHDLPSVVLVLVKRDRPDRVPDSPQEKSEPILASGAPPVIPTFGHVAEPSDRAAWVGPAFVDVTRSATARVRTRRGSQQRRRP